jgi:hypothetical protein
MSMESLEITLQLLTETVLISTKDLAESMYILTVELETLYLLINVRFVWIIATFNSNQDRAISTVQIQIQDKQDENRWDLSAGTGGDYRYLHPLKEGSAKITDIKLLRRSEKVEWATVRNLGFQGWSGDINQGRGGEFLHLVWKY